MGRVDRPSGIESLKMNLQISLNMIGESSCKYTLLPMLVRRIPYCVFFSPTNIDDQAVHSQHG